MISYADDMILVAKNRDAMIDMMDTLKKFLKQRRLILNVEKTTMMVFNGKRRKGRKVECRARRLLKTYKRSFI